MNAKRGRRALGGAALALALCAAAAAAQTAPPEAWPEGYGERWRRVVSGWRWAPAPRGEAGALAGVSREGGEIVLLEGEWWFAEARDAEHFRLTVTGGAGERENEPFEAYAVTGGAVEVGPSPEHVGAPPARLGLLAVRLPWSRAADGLRVSLEPGQSAEWIGIRCCGRNPVEYRFHLDACERVRPHEIWERLERAVRRSGAPAWPVPADPEFFPGHDVGRFLRAQRVLLPWPPAADSPEQRRLRAAAWCATDLLARVPVREHAQVREWRDGGSARYTDDQGRPWLLAGTLEAEVKGPCVLRVLGRLSWSERVADQARQLDVAVAIGDVRARLTGWPAADLEETSRVWDARNSGWNGGAPRELIASPRELRIPVPPGRWKVTVAAARPAWLLVQELVPIEQREHASPWRNLQRFTPADWRAAAAESVALELLGRPREALDLLARWDPPPAGDPALPPGLPSLSGWGPWFLWRRMALALALRDDAACDALAPRLVPFLGRLRGDLEAEIRLALLRYALATRRDGMASLVAQWIFDDPPAEPEDFTEALSAWCIGRRPMERMRTWPISAPPRALRRFLRDIEAQSVREVFGTWADLGTVGTTAGGRRWVIPIEPRVDRRVLRGDAYSAWLNLRSLSGAGPWFVSRAENLRARALGSGHVQVIPAADWVAPAPLRFTLHVPRHLPEDLGRLRFRDPHAIGHVAFSAPDGATLTAAPVGPDKRVYLWRGRNLLFGLAGAPDASVALLDRSPHSIWHSRSTPEGWAFLTELFPLQGPPGSPRALDFRGEDYPRAGLARYRLGVALTAEEALRSHDIPFTVWVGGEPLPQRRLLWIAGTTVPEGEPGAEFPRAETYAPGPIVTGLVLLAHGPALVRLEVAREVRAWGSVAELDVAATPPALLLDRGEAASRRAPPSGLWAGPRGVTGDPEEALATAAATRAVLEAPGGEERAARLEERARLLFRMGRSQAAADFEEAVALYAPDSEGSDRARMALAVLAFRSGDDLELRARVEEMLRSGARSRELFLLAAAAALGTDEVPSAQSWFAAAGAEPGDGSTDLERLVAVALDRPAPAGEAADALLDILTRLLVLRRLDPGRAAGPALADIAARCDREALHAASVYLHGRGSRFAQWALECRLLAPYAGTGDWPPPPGLLGAFSRARDLRSEEVISTPPRVRLAGRFGAWQAAWMTEGAELVLELPGPDLYQFEWRTAHAVAAGVASRAAAPARLVVEGLPGPAVRSIVTSEPSRDVVCERLPWARPGAGDQWTAIAPSGKSRVRVRVQAGAGFLTVRRVTSPAWMAWDARAGGAVPAQPFPPAPPAVAWAADPAADPVADIVRRLDASRRAEGPPEALTALADDLLYCVLARPVESPPEWVVRALDLYMKAHADGLGNPHWQAHFDLARVLTRWTTVDLGADLPEFRRIRISRDLPDDPALAVSNALFFPFPDDTTSVLFDSDDVVEWHHRSAAEEALVLELVASPEPASAEPLSAEILVDGAPAASGPLAPGRRARFPLGRAVEALVQVRVAAATPGMRVRARVRLMRETAAGLEAVAPMRRGILYRAPGGPLAIEVRGPTLVRLEAWAPADLLATGDPAEWAAEPAPIARTFFQGVARAGAASAVFNLPGETFVRVSVRTVDAPALARAAPPPVPRGPIAEEAEALAAPDLRIYGPPPSRETWRLVEYPGMAEAFCALALRNRGSRSRTREDAEEDELRGAVRFHWNPYETGIYVRAALEEAKLEGTPAVTGAEARYHHYFLERPDLDARIVLSWAGQELRRYETSRGVDARLRWQLRFDEQWLGSVYAAYNHVWHSLRDEDPLSGDEPHPDIYTEYRALHRRWLELGGRLRHAPWQNVVLAAHAAMRTNDSLRPDDPDRYTYGLEARAHYESFFAEMDIQRVYRVADRDRRSRRDERTLGVTLGYERWLRHRAWLSLSASFRWSPDDHAREASLALTLRFAGASGERLDHVDPELVRFPGWQDARYPWRP